MCAWYSLNQINQDKKKAQSSIEYLIIIGFALVIMVVLAFVYDDYTNSSKIEIAQSQIDRIGKKIIDVAEDVYFLGSPTRSSLKVYLPSNIMDITILSNEINFRMRKNGNMISDMPFVSSVNITGNLSYETGIKTILIIAQDGRVCIIEKGMSECS